MQIIRRDTDYAVRALLQLASGKGAKMTAGELANACDIPKSFAHKVLKRMANAGLVVSSRGSTGGFQMTKNPKQVCLNEIISLMQGPVSVSECVLGDAVCSRRGNCPLSTEWRKLQDSVIHFLQRTTLCDVLEASGSSKKTRVRSARSS